MSPASLATLRENLKNPPTTGEHIGVYNVAARLRLQGGGSGLDIGSQPGVGTTVELRLPLVLTGQEEENDD